MTALTQRDAQRQHDNACDCCGDTHGEWLDSLAADLSDGEVTNLLAEAGIDDTILEAAVYAVRHNDPLYLVRTYERLAGPVIQKAARDEAERLGDPT
jgi:hypothetical protein